MNRNKRVARVPGTFAAVVIVSNLLFALYMLALIARAVAAH